MCGCVCVCVWGEGKRKEQCFQFQSTPNGVSDSTCKVATDCYATPSWLVIGAKSCRPVSALARDIFQMVASYSVCVRGLQLHEARALFDTQTQDRWPV